MAGESGEPGARIARTQEAAHARHLIDAAIELCERQGFERTTVEQIAAIADVSPRTFSRYFATKDAVVLAFVDDAIELAAVELARQPRDINHLEALYRAYVTMYRNTKTAGNGRTDGRAADVHPADHHVLADVAAGHHGVPPACGQRRVGQADGRRPRRSRLRLVAAVWASIIMTALADLTGDQVAKRR